MAGLACADALRDAGHSVTLFDKGRGPGGRMATRRMETPLGDVFIDHGAQYFTVRDPGFRQVVDGWRHLGLAAPWPLAGADAWVGLPGMNAVVRRMAAFHDVNWDQQITGMVRKHGAWTLISKSGESGQFDAVILAIPAEQAAAILSLHDFAMARIALMARSQPCWAGLFVFDRPLEVQPRVIRNEGDIAWAAPNRAKPGRTGPEAWIVQASALWSTARLEASSAKIAEPLLAALAEIFGTSIPAPIASFAHRWRFALSAGTGDGALWNPDIGLGVCGDWLLGPRVECAWLSGQMLAERCVALSTSQPLSRTSRTPSEHAKIQIII